jgi:hypothetical protein
MTRIDAAHRPGPRRPLATTLWLILLGAMTTLPGALAAQEAQDGRVIPGERRATVLVGVGNAFGWFGGQVDYYLLGDRVSVFAGAGYTPDLDDDPLAESPTGVAGAAGVRGFTAGVNHRAFLELSFTQVVVTSEPDKGRHYGPGLQVGYQFTAGGGFSALASGGAGFWRDTRAGSAGETQAALLMNLGLGYTWR